MAEEWLLSQGFASSPEIGQDDGAMAWLNTQELSEAWLPRACWAAKQKKRVGRAVSSFIPEVQPCEMNSVCLFDESSLLGNLQQ